MNTSWCAIAVALLLIALVIWGVVNQLKERHLQDDPMLHDLRRTVEPMFSKDNHLTGLLEGVNHRDILGNIGLYKGNKSYTINKEKVYLCLKDENDEYYTKNMLLYVLLHEISHVICDEIGHTQKFHDIFEEVLMKASEMGIYNPSIPVITNYCEHGSDD